MKKILLPLFTLFLIFNIKAQTITSYPNPIPIGESFTVTASGFQNCNVAPCGGGTSFCNHTLFLFGANSASITRIATTSSSVTFRVFINCDDLTNDDINSISLSVRKEKGISFQEVCDEQGNLCTETCNSSIESAFIGNIPISFPKLETPTNISQIQNAICQNSDLSHNLQFTTTNVYPVYKWYKNGKLLKATETPISPFINVGAEDEISLVGSDDNCTLDSDFFTVNPDITITPTLNINPANSVCSGEVFSFSATAENFNSVEWFEDAGFSNPINPSFISNNGLTINYQADFLGERTLFARAEKNGCYSATKTITLTTYDMPSNFSVTGENQSICGNMANFTLLGNNIESVEWYNSEQGLASQLINTGNTLNLDITDYEIGENQIFFKAISNQGCESDITMIKFNKLDNSGQVFTNSNTEYCKNDLVNISLSSPTSISYEWFEDENMIFPAPSAFQLNNGSIFTYTTTNIGEEIWYYRGINNQGCATQLYSLTINTEDAPLNLDITNNGASFCTNDIARFQASASGNNNSFEFYRNSTGTLQWSNTNVNGNELSLNTSELNIGENKFWFRALNNNTGCETEIKEVSFIVNKAPNIPLQSSGNLEYCLGEIVNITVFSESASSGYQWSYTADFNNLVENEKIGNFNSSLLQYQTTEIGSTTYFYRSLANGCFSDFNSLTVTVNPQVGELTVNGEGTEFCQGELVELVAGAENATGGYQWFLDENGVVPATNTTGSNNNTYRVQTNTNTEAREYVLYVRGINNDNCNSELKRVSFTVKTTPSNLQVTGDTDYCTGEQVLLTPSATNANSYQWAFDENFNNLVNASRIENNALTYLATETENTRYYYRALNNSGCFSEVNFVDVEILEGVSNLEVTNNNVSVCQGEEIVFVANANNANTYRFFDSNGIQISSSNSLSLDTSNLEPNGYQYQVQAFNNNGCNSDILSFSFVVLPVPNQPTVNGNTTYCEGEFLELTAASNGATSFSWYSDPLLNNQITSNISGSQGQTLSFTTDVSGNFLYYVLATNNSDCSSTIKEVSVTVNPQVGELTVNGEGTEFCQGELVELVAGAENATGGYQWFLDENGVVPAANTTGSNNNTYRLQTNTNTEAREYVLYVRGINNDNCNSELKRVSFTVKTTPSNLQVTGDTDYCTGEQVLLTPSATNANSYQWAFDENFNNLVNASRIENNALTYLATETENTRYYYRALNNSGCFSEVNFVDVEILEGVSNLEVTNNNVSVCQGEEIVFVANANNANTYRFFDSNGIQISSSNSLSLDTSNLEPNGYQYQVQAFNNNGCNSDILSFSFVVLPVPNQPTVNGNTTYCEGEFLELTAASNGATSFSWYSDPLLNNQISSNISGSQGQTLSFTTDVSGNFLYYVLATNNSDCSSTIKEVSVTVNPQVGELTVNGEGAEFCQGELVELVAGAENATGGYQWFLDENGVVPAANTTGSNNNTYRVQTNTNTEAREYVLYVRGINNDNCNSELKRVSFTVRNQPVNLQLEGNTDICIGETVNISLSSNFGESYQFFLDINEFNPINPSWYTEIDGSKIEFTPNSVGEIRLYYKALNQFSCESPLNSVTIIVNEKPTSLDITNKNASFCLNELATFEASAFNVDYFEFWKNEDLTLPVEADFIFGGNDNRFTIDTSILGSGEYTYYLVGVNESGCSTDALPFSFSVLDIPLTPSFSGQTSICIGENLEIEVISEGATSFNWFYDSAKNFPLSPLDVIGNGSNISVLATQEENGFLYFEAVNDEGCTSELINFPYQFNVAPNNLNVISSSETVCVNQEINIEVGAENATGGYLWWKDFQGTIPLEEEFITGSSSNRVVFTPTEENIGVNNFFVQAINNSGCTTDIQEVSVNVLALPTIVDFFPNSADYQYLNGESIFFSLNANNYTNYRILKDGIPLFDWEEGNITNFNLTNNANLNDEAIYTIEISNGFCSDSFDFQIFVFDLDVEIRHNKNDNINFIDGFQRIVINQGEEITFNTNFSNQNYTYDWDFGDGFFQTDETVKHFYNSVGLFNVTLTLTNNETNAFREFEITDKILVLETDNVIEINGLDIPENTEVSFSPNPFKNKLNLTLNNLTNNTNVTLRIYNSVGINFFVDSFPAFSGDNFFSWNNPLGNAPNGVYIAHLVFNGETKVFKLIKS